MSRRKFDPAIKSLLHFDYPYFNEPGDGLGDEIGLESWTKYGNIALYGSEIPNAGTLVPKFGYRCLYTNSGSVQCDNESSIWNLDSEGKYEIGMFVQIDQTGGEKNIFSLMDTEKTTAILNLSVSEGGMLSFEASGFGVESISGTTTMTAETWHHILMRISGRRVRIYLDSNLEISSKLSSETVLAVGQVNIGNYTTAYPVYIDEFMFQHSADKGNPIVPTEPYNGYLDKEIVGGYGTGADGDVIISANTQINSYGIINTITDTRTFTVASWNYGTAIPDVGSEVMIHITAPCSSASADYPLAGLYSFAKVAVIHDASVVLDRDITIENGDNFALISDFLDLYYIQVITVPHYNSLRINLGCTVSPISWNTSEGGGIVAFRCLGNCFILGSIITLGKGAIRYDYHQMTHSKLVDRFLCSRGGGIFITCGGTFFASSNTRLGATWSGLGDGQNGAAGYGGKGTSVQSGNKFAAGGAGGVGGGGGGASLYSSSAASGGAAGKNGVGATYVCSGGGGCGGKGGSIINSGVQGALCAGSGGGGQGNSGGAGGTITHAAGNPYRTSANANIGGNAGTINGGAYKTISTGAQPSGAGGGAPGGDGGSGSVGTKGSAGASIILICNKLKADINALSTGGAGGSTSTAASSGSGGAGGGGTGFCYIAAGELLDE